MVSGISFNDAAHRAKFAKKKSLNFNGSAPSNREVNSNRQSSTVNLNNLSHDLSNIKRAPKISVISFGSSSNGEGKKAFLGAEFWRYDKQGGVSTVTKDYQKIWGGMQIIPYYNGKIGYDEQGDADGEVSVLKKGDTPIYTKEDLTKVSVDDLQPNQYHELEEVVSSKMQWAGEETDVVLYKVKGTPEGAEEYMVYSDGSANMTTPYKKPDGSSYSYSSTSNKTKVASLKGDPEVQFTKAFVELMPKVAEKGIDVDHFHLSDAQTAWFNHFAHEKAKNGDKYWQEKRAAGYTMHNIGPGYQGELNPKTAFYSCANKVQIEAVENDSEYKKAQKEGSKSVDKYFKQFFEPIVDEKGSVNSSKVPTFYAEKRAIHVNGVAEKYMESAATNEKVAPGLTKTVDKGMKEGYISGILNGFDDEFTPAKPFGGPFELYNNSFSEVKSKREFKPFETFEKDAPYKEIIRKKQINAQNMFRRLAKGTHPEIGIGISNRTNPFIGHIDDKWVKQVDKFLETGEKSDRVNVFTSWGRGDFQKGLDITLDAFIEHAKTDEGKNSVLIFGGQQDLKNPDCKNLLEKVKKAVEDPDLKGRIAFMNGFAPNKPLASIADSTVFASRFAPCELTDFEAMLQGGAAPAVTGTQGLEQKNFDIRDKDLQIPDDADDKTKAELQKRKQAAIEHPTGYKTKNEYYMSDKQLSDISEGYKKSYQKMFDDELASLKLKGVKDTINFKEKDEAGNEVSKNITINELAEKRVKKTKDFENLYRAWADDVLKTEFTEIMNHRVTVAPEDEEKMIRNSLNVKPGWKENHALHPDGDKSSYDLYNEKHFSGNNKKFKDIEGSVFNFDDNKLKEIQGRAINNASEAVNGNAGAAGGETKVVVSEMSHEPLEKAAKSIEKASKSMKVAAWVAGTAAIVAGGAIALSKAVSKQPSQYSDTFQPSASRNNTQKRTFNGNQRRPYTY